MTELYRNVNQPFTPANQEYLIDKAIGGLNLVPELGTSVPEMTDLDQELVQLNAISHEPTVETGNSEMTDLELVLAKLNHVDEEEVSLSGLKKFLKKFGVAEGVGTTTAIVSAYITHKNGGDIIDSLPTAVAASVGETVGFYGASLAQEYRKVRSEKELGRTKSLGRAVLNETRTYGPFEAVDFFATRPMAMWLTANIIPGGPIVQTVGGKLLGDVPFFASASHFHTTQERLESQGIKPTMKNILIDDKQRIAASFVTRKERRAARKAEKHGKHRDQHVVYVPRHAR